MLMLIRCYAAFFAADYAIAIFAITLLITLIRCRIYDAIHATPTTMFTSRFCHAAIFVVAMMFRFHYADMPDDIAAA